MGEELYMQQDESKYIEYKESKSKLSDSLWETYSAFANTSGGVIILGVSEITSNNGVKKYLIEGVENPHQQEEQFLNLVRDKNTTTYNALEDIAIKTLSNGKKIIEIIVKAAPISKRPVEVVDKKTNSKVKNMVAYVREGSSDRLAKGELYQALIRNSEGSLDKEIMKNYDIDDLDLDSILRYRKKVETREKYRYFKDFSLEEFLEQIGVVAKDYDGDGKRGVTAGGLLFFGKNTPIIYKFPYFQMELFDYRSDSRWKHRISTVSDNLNLYQFFEEAMLYLLSSKQNEFLLDNTLIRIDSGERLSIALREALINMIMHADYYSQNLSRIEIYWDYYDFINPGMMKISPTDFFTTNESKTRNSIISKLLVYLGYGERGGTGGGQIYAVTNDSLRAPQISTDIEKTELRIWSVDYADSIKGVSKHANQILKILSKEKNELSKTDFVKKLSITSYAANKALNELLNEGYIERVGSGPKTRYRIPMSDNEWIANIKQMAADLKFEYNQNTYHAN